MRPGGPDRAAVCRPVRSVARSQLGVEELGLDENFANGTHVACARLATEAQNRAVA